MNDAPQTKLYFNGLHGLRFFAAFGVFLHHMALGYSWSGINVDYSNMFSAFFGMVGFADFMNHRPSLGPMMNCLGVNGVTLFFVLSGFLITYLLLEEARKTKTISIRDFYLRRVLRIWPLYYLTLIVGVWVVPHFAVFAFSPEKTLLPSDPIIYKEGLTSFFLFSTHFMGLTSGFFYPAPLFTVGIEEHFYLIWPHVVKYCKRILGLIFIAVIAFMLLSKNFYYLKTARWETMAVGGLFAYLLFHSRKVASSPWAKMALSFFMSVWVQVLNLMVLLWAVCTGLQMDGYTNIFLSLSFGILILNVSSNPKSIVKLENRFFRFMGEISYGMYCFNWFAIGASVSVFAKIANLQQRVHFQFLCDLSALAVTVILASASYFLFERRVLRLKNRFAHVKSGVG